MKVTDEYGGFVIQSRSPADSRCSGFRIDRSGDLMEWNGARNFLTERLELPNGGAKMTEKWFFRA